MAEQKKTVVVLYGGRSAEHEVSCRSAAFVLKNLDSSKYNVVAVAIDKDGTWLPQGTKKSLKDLSDEVAIKTSKKKVDFSSVPLKWEPIDSLLSYVEKLSGVNAIERKDLVMFPVLHGTFGEDGTLQGMFDLAEIAYVGSDMLGSAVAMDKAVAKKLVSGAGVTVVPWIEVGKAAFEKGATAICQKAVSELRMPVFVKPARLGSSIGITRVKSRDDLAEACRYAFQYDDKIIIEKALDAREIECAALGPLEPVISVPGEVIPRGEFYSYKAKYEDKKGAEFKIPADLTEDQVRIVQLFSKKAYEALGLYGMARIDMFLEKSSGRFIFNEANTIPGFTAISQYPMLMKQSGVGHVDLLDKLIELAIIRTEERSQLKRSKE